MRVAGLTHVGRRRSRNDDVVLLRPEVGLVVVCDGADGDTAARMTADAIASAVASDTATPRAALLAAAIRQAAVQVRERWDDQFYETAMVGAILLDASGAAVATSVGDTRCYRLHDGRLEHLTGRAVAPDRATALKALHASSPQQPTTPRWENAVPHLDEVQVVEVGFDPGDLGLVCTDGLHKDVAEAEIVRILAEHAEDLQAAAAALVDAANAAGGRDNIGVAVFGV